MAISQHEAEQEAPHEPQQPAQLGARQPQEEAAAGGRSQFEALVDVNVQDMLSAFGWEQARRIRPLLELLCRPPAAGFARLVLRYDEMVGELGLAAGAAWVLGQFGHTVRVHGREHLPAGGPVLLLSNHPGMTDTMALFAAIARPDLLTIAADRPFLRLLPHTSRSLLYVAEQGGQRQGVVRTAAGHLRRGGALLTFPAGEIEPDPAVLPGPRAALEGWNESTAFFVKLAPEAAVVPVVVGGVLSARAQRNPLTRLRRTRQNREKVAAMLQIVVPAYRAARVTVAFGPPIAAAELAGLDDAAAAKRAIVTAMRRLIDAHFPNSKE